MKKKVTIGDYFPKADGDIMWVYVHTVEKGIVKYYTADKDWTKGEMPESEFLNKYYLVSSSYF